jgi:hypothetical protein
VPPEQEPDEIIGEFRRGKEIGRGSFAAVYLAQHRVGLPERTRSMHPSEEVDKEV